MKNRIITQEQIENFYRYLCSEERTENTVTKYLRDIAAFREWNGEVAVTKDRVIAYKQHLTDTGYKVRSINSISITSVPYAMPKHSVGLASHRSTTAVLPSAMTNCPRRCVWRMTM